MKIPSSPPLRSGLERFSLGLAGAMMGVSVTTLIGWWGFIDEFLQPFGIFTPMPLNAALGFAALGLALLAIEAGRRPWVACASLALVLGGLTLFEHTTGTDLAIDEAFGAHRLLAPTVFPGRPSVLTAVLLVASSLVLLWRLTHCGSRGRVLAEAVTGSIVAAAGFSILFAYGTDLPDVYAWGSAVPTSPTSAVALVILGLALVTLAWRDHVNDDGNAPAWSPLPVVFVCLSITAILWIGLRQREHAYVTQNTQARAEQFALRARELIEKQSAQLERLARAWGDLPGLPLSTWDADARRLLTEGAAELGCHALGVVDAAFRTVWIHPGAPSGAPLGFNHGEVPERLAALRLAAAGHGAPAVTLNASVQGASGPESGLVIYAPLLHQGRPAGFIVAEYSARKFVDHVVRSRLKLDTQHQVLVALGDEILLQTPAPPGDAPSAVDRTYTIADRRVRLRLQPSDTTLAVSRRPLPEVALAAGIGITVLLGLSVHFARRAQVGQRAAESSSEQLRAENEERRRIEGRLKVSDDRLRLALDSTQIGIFEWSVPAGHVYYSPALWAMLGYDQARMPSTIEAWQSLLHPDDLPVYRRRTESQLRGIASFIEPEYRVRARCGDWRWVYTRAKTVATDEAGRPLRIVGTVQDVTARREAELALRESQSAARKLSLVAAKTDNPVLISSADGRIEWANEAFCRMLEYALDEVVGRNPVHFMTGPDTDARTITRIRTAMGRGAGISTDVVNYSSSGRKYHLHVEIQPVRGADGAIEHFIAVGTDITARVETEDQLRRAKAEADEASRAKSEFLASMSHEIRTPMNGVIGMTSLLLDTPLSGEQRDFVNTIRTSGEALLTVINDILDFSKIESGKMEVEHTPFELSLCLEEALDLFALQASAKRLELGYAIAPDVPGSLLGDATRLRQVVVNLVNNAVKFTPGGSVSVEVRRAPAGPDVAGGVPAGVLAPDQLRLEFTVRDTGVGIPPDRIDRLFRPFSQVDSSTTRKYGGTGLGLAISQRLCRLMGGHIRVESGPGRGTAFVFTIRATAASGTSDSGLSTTPQPLRGGWILCVEDHPVTQARLRTLIETWRVECVIVPTADAALAVARERTSPPALLVVDVGPASETASPLETLAVLQCPCMALYPFGETPPAAPAGGRPFGSTTKPLRTISFVLGVVGLFQPQTRDLASPADRSDRPLGDEVPLEVLIAEDNAVNQKVALRFLERLGYRADAVANGLEAVTTLEHRRYDLVLMDLQMPEMDGFEATRQIRRRLPPHRQPRIIALTANAMQGDRDQCVAAGMDDHISKPVKMHEIAEAIRRHFPRPEYATTETAAFG
jgi:PAS domain S-box-containing protein